VKRPPESVWLGLLQGPAELLPISSSAHIRLLGGHDDKALEVALHAGSLAALLANFAGSDLLSRRDPATFAFSALTVGPPALAALVAGDLFERRLGTPRAMAAGLLLGSVLLLVADGREGERGAGDATAADALAIGAAQALALWPGTSRSATTLTAAVLRGFTPEAAAELSGQALVPVLAAATVKKAPGFRAKHAPAALAAAASTALSLKMLGPPKRLRAFAAYRTALAIATLWQDHSR
jgi:undecaprenyl-diphosphatase